MDTDIRSQAPTEKPALVIMAAGMGSRFGGLKQITPIGPSGEMIIDYSIYDALAAGFETVVFIIKREIEEMFRQTIGDRIARHADVKYVYQETDAIPAGLSVPAGRTKPWGTGHAVLCCRDIVGGPFAVINADDYYGRQCFKLLYEFLTSPQAGNKLHLAMAGYILENTLTEHGYVSRGICSVDDNNLLTGIVERTRIELKDGAAVFSEDGGQSWTKLQPGSVVSMNCWALPSGALDDFESLFKDFLRSDVDLKKAEFYLPFAINSLVETGKADVRVLHTDDRWYGMTYADDRSKVTDAIGLLVKQGIYPKSLWNFTDK